MTPDKIYLGIRDLGSGYTYDLSLDNNGEQEYIRKDALIEWLNDNIKPLNVLFGEIFVSRVKDKLKLL